MHLVGVKAGRRPEGPGPGYYSTGYYSTEETSERFKALHVAGFLHKPFLPTALLLKIRKLLEG